MHGGVELADPADEHERQHRRVVGHDVRSVVGHVADAHAGRCRRRHVDVVHPDAVADDHGGVGEAAELVGAERGEVREHDVRAVERLAELVGAPELRAGLLRERPLERVVAEGGVGHGDDRRHTRPPSSASARSRSRTP
jgi:hypothetical protein